ncbi:putative phage abortive infection protein [Pseudomonas aeruginosa]|uniref:putative phage abortive infection protein n=1 Tax=Pseudomonas aeruginosa TaxID=287 RepID=UPI003AFAD1EB
MKPLKKHKSIIKTKSGIILSTGYRIFIRTINPRAKINFRHLYYLFLLAALSIILVLLINLILIFYISSPGEWGDFFGGVLNPILTFLTFMGLLITIVIQQTELRESRQELKRSADALSEQVGSTKRQIFESTFFNMMNMHASIIDSIDLRNQNGRVTKGRDCFVVFYNRPKQYCEPNKSNAHSDQSELNFLRECYKDFWEKHQLELGHYFRFLYNIFRFIKESGFSEGPYSRLIRAQLSDQELLVIFYNCIASIHGDKFKSIAEEFSLFDNIPRELLFSQAHLSLIAPSAFNRENI